MNNKGYSIVEVLISCFILAGLAYFATTIFQSDKKIQQVHQIKISNNNNLQRIIGKTVTALRTWSGDSNDLPVLFSSIALTDNQNLNFFSGSSAIDTIVGSDTISSCQMDLNASKLNFCLFSNNTGPIKVDDAMISARVVHFDIILLDMRDSNPISSIQFANSPIAGGQVKYFFHTWTKINSKNVKTTINGVFYFAK